VGFITLYEAYALYAEGVFGIIPEFYVHPQLVVKMSVFVCLIRPGFSANPRVGNG